MCCVQGAEFFTALFGSERFEHLVGELMIAAAARVGGDLGASQLRKLQVRLQPVAAHGWSCIYRIQAVDHACAKEDSPAVVVHGRVDWQLIVHES